MLYQLSYARSGGGRIRTFVGISRQIYSLLPLATRAPHPYAAPGPLYPLNRPPRVLIRGVACEAIAGNSSSSITITGADEGTRTLNLLITNQLLYRLSYVSTPNSRVCASLQA